MARSGSRHAGRPSLEEEVMQAVSDDIADHALPVGLGGVGSSLAQSVQGPKGRSVARTPV